jgi:translation initiation factor 5
MTAEANVGGPMVIEAEEEGEEEVPDMGVPTTGTDIDAALGRGGDPIIDQPDQVEELSKKLAETQVDEDDEEGGDSPYAVLGAWLDENKGASDDEIKAKIEELGLGGKHKVLLEIGEHLFNPESVGPELQKRVSLLEPVSQFPRVRRGEELISSWFPARNTRNPFLAVSSDFSETAQIPRKS